MDNDENIDDICQNLLAGFFDGDISNSDVKVINDEILISVKGDDNDVAKITIKRGDVKVVYIDNKGRSHNVKSMGEQLSQILDESSKIMVDALESDATKKEFASAYTPPPEYVVPVGAAEWQPGTHYMGPIVDYSTFNPGFMPNLVRALGPKSNSSKVSGTPKGTNLKGTPSKGSGASKGTPWWKNTKVTSAFKDSGTPKGTPVNVKSPPANANKGSGTPKGTPVTPTKQATPSAMVNKQSNNKLDALQQGLVNKATGKNKYETLSRLMEQAQGVPTKQATSSAMVNKQSNNKLDALQQGLVNKATGKNNYEELSRLMELGKGATTKQATPNTTKQSTSKVTTKNPPNQQSQTVQKQPSNDKIQQKTNTNPQNKNANQQQKPSATTQSKDIKTQQKPNTNPPNKNANQQQKTGGAQQKTNTQKNGQQTTKQSLRQRASSTFVKAKENFLVKAKAKAKDFLKASWKLASGALDGLLIYDLFFSDDTTTTPQPPSQPSSQPSSQPPPQPLPQTTSGGKEGEGFNWPLFSLLAIGVYAGYRTLRSFDIISPAIDSVKKAAKKAGEILFMPVEALTDVFSDDKDDDEADDKEEIINKKLEMAFFTVTDNINLKSNIFKENFIKTYCYRKQGLK